MPDKLSDKIILELVEKLSSLIEQQESQTSGLIDVVKLLNEELIALKRRVIAMEKR